MIRYRCKNASEHLQRGKVDAWHILPLAVLLLTFVSVTATAVQPYEPDIIEPVLNPWQWQELESLASIGVQCIAESKSGFWLGSQKGVYFYDGFETRRYGIADGLPSEAVSNVLVMPDESVIAITSKGIARYHEGAWDSMSDIGYQDQRSTSAVVHPDGTVWIANERGLIRLTLESCGFVGFQDTGVSELLLTRSNQLWVCAIGKDGVYQCPIEASQLSHPEKWRFHTLKPTMPRERVFMQENAHGGIWAISDRIDDLLHYFDPNARTWKQYHPDQQLITGLNSDLAVIGPEKVLLTDSGNLRFWHQNQWKRLTSPTYPIPGETPRIKKMRSGELWVYGSGEKVFRINNNIDHQRTLRQLMFIGDHQQTEWFLHHDGRVISHERTTGKWSAFDVTDGIPDTPVDGFVSSDGVVWVTGSHEGVASVARRFAGQWVRDQHPDFSFRVQHHTALETRQHRIRFGAAGNPSYYLGKYQGGILEYMRDGNDFTYHYLRGQGIPFRISGQVQTGPDTFWISGRSVMQLTGGICTDAQTDENLKNTWSDGLVSSSDGTLWISRWGLGVFRYREDHWKLFNQTHAPFGNYASHLFVDDKEQTWVAAPSGIYVHDGTGWSPPVLNGKITIARNAGSLKQDELGRLWINQFSYNWINREELADTFRPNPIQHYTTCLRRDTIPPETYITEHTRHIAPGSSGAVSWTGTDYLDQTFKKHLQFSYRMNSGAWSEFTAHTTLHLSNLKPGTYHLEVRARDADLNIDPTPAVASFTVLTPLWQHPLFLAGILLAGVTILLLAAIYFRTRIRLLNELEAVKSGFLNRLDQELRGQLSNMLPPLRKLKERLVDPDAIEWVALVEQKSAIALRIVHDLLALKESESTPGPVPSGYGDLGAFLDACVAAWSTRFTNKDVEMIFSNQLSTSHHWFCPDAMQRIIDNLISFGLERSPSGSELHLRARLIMDADSTTSLEIRMMDHGVPIPSEKQSLYFEPFYGKPYQPSGMTHSETAIGLPLAKSVVTSLGGTISMHGPSTPQSRSTPGGMEIRLRVPIHASPTKDNTSSLISKSEAARNVANRIDAKQRDQQTALLQLIMDDADMRRWVAGQLQPMHKVIVASEGEGGLKQAILERPDLILIDLSPPKHSLEWLERFHHHPACSHIPLILLCDIHGSTTEQSAFDAGANSIIHKPLQVGLLQAQVQNLLSLMQRQRTHHLAQFHIEEIQGSLNPETERFLNRCIQLMQEHLSDEQFDVDALAGMLAMSRSTLYRKFSSATSESPSNYLRSLRLQHAAHLLTHTRCTVAEAMESVGILDASTFSKSFKAMHGCPPSKFRDQCSNSPYNETHTPGQ